MKATTKILAMIGLRVLRAQAWDMTQAMTRVLDEDDRDPLIVETLFEVLAALDSCIDHLAGPRPRPKITNISVTEKSAATEAGA